MAVLGLWLERNGHCNRTVLANFKELRLDASFHDQGVPIVKADARTELLVFLAQFVTPNDLPFPGNFFGHVTDGDQNVARLKDKAIPSIALRLPDDLAFLV